MPSSLARTDRLIAVGLVIAVLAYIGWRAVTSPEQALQFGFNGLSVGAVYALMAMGFTLVYSTVWFFDLYYGSAAALGAYGVFYLRSQETLGGQYQVNNPVVNVLFALVVAGVVAWTLYTLLHDRSRTRNGNGIFLVVAGALALGIGSLAWAGLTFDLDLGRLFGEVGALVFGVALAGVLAASVAVWVFHTWASGGPRSEGGHAMFRVALCLLALGIGAYTWAVLTFPKALHLTFGPVLALVSGLLLLWVLRILYRRIAGQKWDQFVTPALALLGGLAALYLGSLLVNAPGSKLYLSWAVSCLLAGSVALSLYRGLYVYMRQRSRSPLVMLVASLGILLALTAFISIVFQSAPRPLPDTFGSVPWTIGGANIKGFNFFAIGVAIIGFLGLLTVLKWTSFGRAIRAIGDDEEVSKVVGINTTVVIAAVFFVGAVYAAMAGILSGHDTAIQPRMGLLLLLKGWIASVMGGIGNLYGALLGGFVLGVVEQFAIWDLAGEWKDVIAFVLLILFLSFWPRGLLPRK